MNRGRVLNLKYQKGSNKPYKKVALRQAWVDRLERNTKRPKYSQEAIDDIIQWTEETSVSTEQLDEALPRKSWRLNGKKSVNF